jgi:hypothetical protein
LTTAKPRTTGVGSPLGSRAARPPLVSLLPRYDPPVTKQWTPFDGQRREPLLERVRDLWTLQGIMSTCTAAIYRNDFGLELRVDVAGELVESRLSRVGEEPLLFITERLKADLIEQGWFEQPNAT